jgi:WD40 repeat protein
MRLLPVRSGHIEVLAYAPDGARLATSANPWGRVWLWDLRTGEVALLKEARRGAPLAYSPSGGLLAAGGERQVSLRDSGTGVQRYFLNASRHQSKRLAFTTDGQTLVSAGVEQDEPGRLLSESTVVCLWDVTTGRRRKLPVPLFSTDALAVAADASVILWGEPRARGVPARLTLWHVPGRLQLARLSLAATPACAAFSPTRRRLALGVEDMVLLYDVGRTLDFFEEVLGSSPWATLTLPFRQKLIASRQPPIDAPKVLEGHRDGVLALAFSPDGETLFSGGRDRTVRCWDVASLRERAAWGWPIGVVYSLAVAPDGMTAAAGGNAGRSVIWDLAWF